MQFQDPFDEFLHFYEKGLIDQALQVIIPDPAFSYDSLHSSEKTFPYFVNFADASVFKGALEFKQTFLVLESFCQESPALKIITQAFLEAIRQGRAVGRMSGPLVHLSSTVAKVVKRLGLSPRPSGA